MDIFLLGCTAIYSRRLLNSCTSRVCSSFTDTEFPATSRSLGKWHDKTPEEIDKEVEWYRADELFAPIPEEEEKGDCTHKPKCFLFEGRIEGNDIDQGQLGDCWLMTALACLAEASPDAIVNLFMTREYNPAGMYVLRLYHPIKKQWELVTVDDKFPCRKTPAGSIPKPLFAKPNGRELWVMIIEKAYAKFIGGYDLLDGGLITAALHVLTGDPIYKMVKKDNGEFRCHIATWEAGDGNDELGRPKPFEIRLPVHKSRYSFKEDQVFHILKKYKRRMGALGAGTHGKDEGDRKTEESGLVPGHAYSIFDVRNLRDSSWLSKAKRIKLMALRNPWGQSEWKGAFSDDDIAWGEHNRIKKTLKHVSEDDGLFWIPYDDFLIHFRGMDLVDRTTGFRDISLEFNEARGCLGPLWGCTLGCLSYWFLLEGCRSTCLGHTGDLHGMDRAAGKCKAQDEGKKYSPGESSEA